MNEHLFNVTFKWQLLSNLPFKLRAATLTNILYLKLFLYLMLFFIHKFQLTWIILKKQRNIITFTRAPYRFKLSKHHLYCVRYYICFYVKKKIFFLSCPANFTQLMQCTQSIGSVFNYTLISKIYINTMFEWAPFIVIY